MILTPVKWGHEMRSKTKLRHTLLTAGLTCGLVLSTFASAGQATAAETQTVNELLSTVSTDGVSTSLENGQRAESLVQELLNTTTPAASVSKLSNNDKALVKLYGKITYTSPTIATTEPRPAFLSAALGSAGCQEMTAYTDGNNAFGARVFRVWLRGGECWNTLSRTTDAWYISTWTSDLGLGWRDGGEHLWRLAILSQLLGHRNPAENDLRYRRLGHSDVPTLRSNKGESLHDLEYGFRLQAVELVAWPSLQRQSSL